MTTLQRTRATARVGIAAAAIALGALVQASTSAAEPVLPTPVPGEPVPPGQPVVIQDVAGGDAPPAPPPIGAPVVPEIPNAQYGSGSGPLGSIRDAWRQAKDPFNYAQTPAGQMPAGTVPAGAGPAPALPPGFTSINSPESSTPAAERDYSGGPPLPEGYTPIGAGPPPGYEYVPGGVPVAPPAPTYTPVVSPPPPPLYPQQ